MLSRVVVKNFKSIGEPGVDLELKPLTILVGPNGSGKSSILESIAFVAQSVEKELSTVGGLISYPTVTDLAHKGETHRWFHFTTRLHNEVYNYTLEFRPDTSETCQTLSGENGEYLTVKLEGDRREGFQQHIEDPVHSSSRLRVDFVPILQGLQFAKQRWGGFTTDIDLDEAAKHVDSMAARMKDRVFFLSAFRGSVPFSEGTGVMPKWVGVKGEWLLPLLSLMESPRYESVRKEVAIWAREFALQNVKAGLRAASVLAADYSDPVLRTPLNLAMASHGARQVLTVITQLFWSPPDSLILMEEPEISLHPESQVKLLELFAKGISQSRQIILTTHSSLLLLAIGRAVGKQKIQTDDVAIYDVSKIHSGTRAKKLSLLPNGYIRGWVPSFKKTERDLMKQWVESLPEA